MLSKCSSIASMAPIRSPFGFGTVSARKALSRCACASAGAGSTRRPAASSTGASASALPKATTMPSLTAMVVVLPSGSSALVMVSDSAMPRG